MHANIATATSVQYLDFWTFGHKGHKERMGGAAAHHSLYLFAIGLHSLRPPCSVDIYLYLV